MSHDFAKGKAAKAKKRNTKTSPSKAEPKPRLPGWIWFISGVVVTVFGQFLLQLAQVDTSELDKKSPANTTSQQNQQAPEVTKPKRPKIEFYNTLKNREVKVPSDVVAAREQEDYHYALQAGAFKVRSDAEQQRAEIILMGLDASIESKKNKSGTLYHRIIVGPFTSRSALSSARNKLIRNNVPTMRIKRQ